MAGRRSSRTTGRSPGDPDEAVPRLRDVPAPRRNQSAIGPLFQAVFTWPYRFGLYGLYRLGVHAWHVTALSLACNVAVGWLLLTERRFLPGILLLPAGILDILDGGVARLRGEAGPAGAFLDSVMDRVSDFIIFACLYWSLAGQGDRLAAALALSSLVVSLLVSHIRAEAEAIGVTMSEGFFQRIERYVALMIGLTAPGLLTPVLIVLTALGAITVVQRLASAIGHLARRGSPSRT